MSPFKDPEKRKEYERKRYLENKQYYAYNNKLWRENNKEYVKDYIKKYRAENGERLENNRKKWWENNKKNVNKKRRDRYANDVQYREIIKEKSKQVAKTYSYKKKTRENAFKRRRSDIQWKLTQALRVRLNKAIRNNQKVGSAVHDLGCTIEELKIHLENQFEEGMTWDNWKHDGWHIDHIKPLNSFDLSDREQFLKAYNYTNLQPLWKHDNLSKGAKIDWECEFK